MALFGGKKKLTQDEVAARNEEIARSLYSGTIPFVDKQYQTNPRRGIADALTATGSNTAPLQGGMTEGIARVLSGLGGGYIGKQERDKAKIAEDFWGAKALNAAQAPTAAAAGPVAPAQPPPNLSMDMPGNVSPMGRTASMVPQIQIPQGDPTAVVAGALNPQQGAVPPPAISPNPTIPGQPVTVGPRQTSITPSPQSTPTLSSVAQRSSGARLPDNYSMPVRGGRVEARSAGVSRTERANTGFNSYKSSAYDPIEEKYAAEYGIPVQLLRGIRLNGEKSNANQVSSANARTVYQFTKDTRDLWIKNKGYDPWASPENAVKAAAEHLADDYRSTGGDVKETVARYIAGPSGKNRGPVTRAYVDRVTGGLGGDIPGGSQPSQPSQAQGGSAGQVPRAPEVDVPDLPTAPPEPVRSQLPDQVRSIRMQTARNLLEQNQGMFTGNDTRGAAGLYGLFQPEYEQGAKETQEAALQRDENVAQSIQAEDASKRQLYNEITGAIAKAPIEERQELIRFRNRLQELQYGADVDREAREDQQQYGTSERVAGQVYGEASDQANRMENRYLMERQAELEKLQEEREQRVKANAPASVKTQAQLKDYQDNQTASQSGGRMFAAGSRIATIAEEMDTGGITRSGLSGDMLANYDSGIAELQSLQSEIALNKLGGKLGAGVSNADVAFILKQSPVGPNTPPDLLKAQADAYQMLGQRMSDYADNYLEAQYGSKTNGGLDQFTTNWRRYKNEVKLYNADGSLATGGYIPYTEWLEASRKAGRVK
jgi:hypothetical protein